MSNEVKNKLEEFHQCNEEARKHFSAHELKPGQSIHMHTQVDLLEYSKWRTKADIALNEYHALLVEQNPGKLPWTLEQLEKENEEFKGKLKQTEGWLSNLRK